MTTASGIDPDVPPAGPGCGDCDAARGWWVHLRRCAQRGVLGPRLADPQSHPESQPAPGPQGRVPENWRDLVR